MDKTFLPDDSIATLLQRYAAGDGVRPGQVLPNGHREASPLEIGFECWLLDIEIFPERRYLFGCPLVRS